MHKLATRVAKEKKEKRLQNKLCPCCRFHIERDDIDVIDSNTICLSFLGSGYPLYFHFIKYCITILVIITLTSGEYNLLSNYYGGDCVDNDIANIEKHMSDNKILCIKDWISMFSLANK